MSLHITDEGYSWPTSQGRPFEPDTEFVTVPDFTPDYEAPRSMDPDNLNAFTADIEPGTPYNHRIQQIQVKRYAKDNLGFNAAIQFTAHYSDGDKTFRYGTGAIGARWSESAVASSSLASGEGTNQ